jgi:hypothetical protein
VTVAIDNTVVAAVVCDNTILLDPNVTVLAVLPDELNIPVVKSKPLKSIVPLVSVTVPVADSVSADEKVVVPVWLIVNAPNVVLPLPSTTPVALIEAVSALKLPPLLNVRLFKFNDVVATVNAVVPKLSLLNQLAVVNVITDVPEPVNDSGNELVAEPPVVPKVTVLVVEASVTKPPVPVAEKPVTVPIDRTVVAAVAWFNMMLLVPNAIERVLVLLELNAPTVKSKPFKFNVPAVNVYVPVEPIFKPAPSVTVPAVCVNTGVVNVPPL